MTGTAPLLLRAALLAGGRPAPPGALPCPRIPPQTSRPNRPSPSSDAGRHATAITKSRPGRSGNAGPSRLTPGGQPWKP